MGRPLCEFARMGQPRRRWRMGRRSLRRRRAFRRWWRLPQVTPATQEGRTEIRRLSMPARIEGIPRWWVVLWLSVLVVGLTSCNKQEKPAEAPAQVVQKTFASPDDAAKALVEAAKADN